MRETLLIVVGLIATVTFAAGFTLPGGFVSNEGPDQGLAILLKKVAFKVFIIANTVAVMSSISSLFLHFAATMQFNPIDGFDKYVRKQMVVALLSMLAMIAMTIAFIAGGYAMLAHSPSLAISMCAIGCFPFFMYGRDLELSRRLLREMAIFVWTDFVALAKYMWSTLVLLAKYMWMRLDLLAKWMRLDLLAKWTRLDLLAFYILHPIDACQNIPED